MMDGVIEYLKIAGIILGVGVLLIVLGRLFRRERKHAIMETVGYYVCIVGVFHGIILYYLKGFAEVLNFFVFGAGAIMLIVFLIIYLQEK